MQPIQVGLPPLLFVLYTTVMNQDRKLHQYAIDCPICTIKDGNDDLATVDQFSHCIADVGEWMSSSWLRINLSQTQVMWLGSRSQLEKITIHNVPVLLSSVHVVDTARDLSVVSLIVTWQWLHTSCLYAMSPTFSFSNCAQLQDHCLWRP